ncbi:uncharacterized protein [Palaemon carinicauda]|uniref:uncharacterized protein n=1 Tax=Palaemon carinicauda TaxID=392227 RepID=UPI0035B6012A
MPKPTEIGHRTAPSEMLNLMEKLLASLLVMCFVLWTTYAKADDKTLTVIGLHTKALPLSIPTWLQKEIQWPEGTTHFTICFNIKLLFAHSDKTVLVSLKTDMGVVIEGATTFLYTEKLFLRNNQTVLPWNWNHFCIIIGPEPEMHIDGHKTKSDVLIGKLTDTFKGPYNVSIGVPSHYYNDKAIQTFAGYVALPHISPRKLTEEETQKLARNEELEVDNLANGEWKVFALDSRFITSVIVNQSEMYVEPFNQSDISRGFVTKKEKISDMIMPRLPHDYILINGYYTGNELRAICDIMRGSIPSMNDQVFMDAMFKTATDNPDMTIVLGVQSDNHTCARAYFKPNGRQPMVFYDQCEESSLYAVCKVPRDLYFEMRTHGFPNAKERYRLIPNGTSPRFFSLNGAEVRVSGTHHSGIMLELRKYLSNNTIARTEVYGNQPFGRNRWTFLEEGLDALISISTCSQARHLYISI